MDEADKRDINCKKPPESFSFGNAQASSCATAKLEFVLKCNSLGLKRKKLLAYN